MRFALSALWVTALLGLLSSVRADVVVLVTGEEIAGRIIQEDFERVVLRTAREDMTLMREDIAEIRMTVGSDPNPTRTLPLNPNVSLPPVGAPPPAEEAPVAAAVPEPAPAPVRQLSGAERRALEAANASPEPTGEEIVPPAIPPGYHAVFFMLDGQTEVKRTADWEPAQLGMALQVNNEIRTDEGRSKLMLRGRGQVRLPPRSHLQLAAINEDGTRVTLNLVRGSVWAEVESPTSGGVNFNVQTPDLTAGVRGTVFNVTATPNQGSRVSVVQGNVHLQSVLQPNQQRNVPQGFSVYCDPEGNLRAPEPIVFDLQREWEEWDQWALETYSQLGSFSPVGAGAIQNLTQLTAVDQQVHATMVDEFAYNTNLNRQAEFVQELAAAFVRYAEDTGDLPPSEEPQGADGWLALIEDPGATGWAGPYIPANTPVPVVDGWRNAITYRRLVSPQSGNVYGELISNGPNGVFSNGQTDDVKEIIRLPDELQAEIRRRRTP